MTAFLLPPEGPDVTSVSGTAHLRYEDVTQDGRLLLTALSAMLGSVVWRDVTGLPASRALAEAGIVPILTHCRFQGSPGPFSAYAPMLAEGRYVVARSEDDAGEVTSLFLNMWLDVSAPVGSTWAPPDPNAPRARAGRLFAEHVFTRPFAAPGERKVLRLDAEGLPGVRPALYARADARALVTLPDGARAIGAPIASEVLFSTMHTDSNQHVNSLVYPRVFEEAAVHALAVLGRDPRVLARDCDVRFRKPFFAGERAIVSLQLFEDGARLGATGGFSVDGEALPRTTIRMHFEPS